MVRDLQFATGMRAPGCAVVACCLAFAGVAHAEAGKLDRARDAISGSPSRSSRGTRTEHGRSRADRGAKDDDCSFLCTLLYAIFDGDDDPDPPPPDPDEAPPYGAPPSEPLRPEYGYAPYPYARPDGHYLVLREPELAAFVPGDRASDLPPVLPRPPRRWAGQLALEAGHLQGVTRTGLLGRVMLPDGFELDARGAFLLEAQPDGGGLDRASTGSAHVAYRVLGTHMLLVRLGAGLRYWADAQLGALGVDLLLGFDLFPVEPLVISAHLAGGSLGQAFASDVRVQAGLAFERFEVFAGFEWMHVDAVDLSVPLLGLRLWL